MIDFRSDTVTRPSKAMRTAMANAEVGDDVYGDDPTVNELESWAAERHGFASAMFCSSGTQANLLALMAHCQRGDEYLCGQQAHNYKFEGGGAAILGSIQPQPIANEQDGSLCFKKLAAAIKPDDSHFARTTLLSIENTINGKVLPLTYMAKAREFTQQNNLALHLDGARVYNAASALNVDITEICQHVDSVSICLSKGLGAPIGSLLLGSQALIKSAKRWRKVVGGGMRQAGIIAAAAKIALAQNPEKLAQDHINAKYLAHALNQFTDISVNLEQVETNMVFAKFSEAVDMANLVDKLKADNILLSASNPMRLVTHLDIDKTAIDNFIKKLSHALSQTSTSVKVS
ncbi:low-specificity L-threonine aldolase [Colwellia sp. MB02u-18]|uniref:low-specificity L-threonine aldolase n=1 Tax=unclassified Colwellia TaxID=196834 RepID=UPI0015F744C2|nr:MULTISPECIES: low-specificity L-threonine aldolase [unclassified Colwellia]MBA6223100.1 low-specificity L-threonine aldolase [Colwellia sp. MB3u-45]MBA6267524.1 low-specificity L-threonine aldolase [Colwellia sp. MB3u-43]MBA6320349.1 low-specificity L-threonine aldolase [Colwellia sp. MB02u-19]MBA6323108.1 low-specificity L-threonine aldolase [Colwellia sp. MB02u-18]MBA6330441.1 low-specificity L-threonine aldolase [Colwellia sp. MB02u-12]